MESLAKLKLRIIQMILETNNDELLLKVLNALNEVKGYDQKDSEASSMNEPLIKYSTNREPTIDELLAHPAVQKSLEIGKTRAEKGDFIDNERVHKEDEEWLNSL
jgi:phage pi2 protein 07